MNQVKWEKVHLVPVPLELKQDTGYDEDEFNEYVIELIKKDLLQKEDFISYSEDVDFSDFLNDREGYY